MADLKISQLGSIVTVVPATDVLPVVQGGTTYKITPNQILNSGGTATLASATITGAATVGTTLGVTGNLTVDTNTLFVNSSNDRVGIGTVSPNNTLTVRGTQDAGIEINSADSNSSRLIFAYDPANTRWYINSTISGGGTTLPLAFLIGNTEVARFNTTGNLAFANGKGIDFAATTEAAGKTSELLADYEEGTWTGAIKGSVYDPTTAVSTNGRYTKIGRSVTVDIAFVGVTTTGAVGDISLTGLPFANGSVAAVGSAGIGAILAYSGTLTSVIDPSGTTIFLVSQVSSSYASLATHVAGASKNLYISITYSV